LGFLKLNNSIKKPTFVKMFVMNFLNLGHDPFPLRNIQLPSPQERHFVVPIGVGHAPILRL
jgi:hypothetical protein